MIRCTPNAAGCASLSPCLIRKCKLYRNIGIQIPSTCSIARSIDCTANCWCCRIHTCHFHTVFFTDISRIVRKPYHIASVFRYAKAVSGEGCPGALSLHPVLSGTDAAATISCNVSLLIINSRMVICNTSQPYCSRLVTGSCKSFQFRCLIVDFGHKHLCCRRVPEFIHYHKFIDTVFRHSTASDGHILSHCTIRRIDKRKCSCTCAASLCSFPCKCGTFCPRRRISRYRNGRKGCCRCLLYHLIRSRLHGFRYISSSVCHPYMQVLCGL